MSKEIIDLLVEYADNYDYKFMVIASRNQVDFENSYVCSTEYLSEKIKKTSNILLCRDHCGPYFKDSDKPISLSQAMDKCIQTIDHDIKNNFDLIHVDVSRVETNQLTVARELVEYCLNINPQILLEFGSEENTGLDLTTSLDRVDEQLNFCSQYKNIKFFVTQTGSAIRDKQIGDFDVNRNFQLSKKIHSFNFLFKEHNGDYLNYSDLTLRNNAGIDAINVAPQLGVLQTQVLFNLSKDTEEWNNFANLVYAGNKFQRWVSLDKLDDKLAAVLVSGHYFFNSIEYQKIFNKIDKDTFINKLRTSLFDIIKLYKTF